MTEPSPPHPTRARRIPVRIPIERSTLPVFLDSEIMNLSKGGVFVRTDLPLPPGSSIDFEFTIPGSERVIRAEGIVVWVRKRDSKDRVFLPEHPPGMGVQFSKLASGDVEAILDEIESLIEIS
ncbi:MAG: TIGR02266 family protein [Pseudomonadota bacterium]